MNNDIESIRDSVLVLHELVDDGLSPIRKETITNRLNQITDAVDRIEQSIKAEDRDVVKALISDDIQSLHRKIYQSIGLDRDTATLKQKHTAQRLYDIDVVGNRYVAIRIRR